MERHTVVVAAMAMVPLISRVVSSFPSSVERVQQQTVLAPSEVYFQVLLGLETS